jgi:hypothetical protein
VSLLFATSTLNTEVFIQASPAAVLARLDDPLFFIRLNPLVVAVEPIAGETGGYWVTDKLQFCGVPYHLRYKVRWMRVEEGVDAEVWSAAATRLHNKLRIFAEGSGARVRETVEMTTLRPLSGYVRSAAQESHRDLFARLKRLCESAA